MAEVCLLLFCILANHCDSAHPGQLCSAVPLGDQTESTMTCYPTQSYYPDTEPTSPCSILNMLSARLGSDKYKFLSHWFDSTWARTHEVRIPHSPKTRDGRSTHLAILSGHTGWNECWMGWRNSTPFPLQGHLLRQVYAFAFSVKALVE